MKHKKLTAFQKIYTFKKNKRLHILLRLSYAISAYKQTFKIHIPSLFSFFKELNENVCFNMF